MLPQKQSREGDFTAIEMICENKAYWNGYLGIKPFKDATAVGISTGMTLPLVFLQ